MIQGVCHLTGDHWNGVDSQSWRIESPSASEFEQALLRLDAKHYTIVTIAADSPTHLMIGGGRGQYVVYATFGNEEFWNLVRREPASGQVRLYIGGQDGDFSANRVVDLEQARSAGFVFLSSVKLDSTQQWEKS